MNGNKFFFAVCFVLLTGKVVSQPFNVLLDRDRFLPYEKYLNDKESKNHTCIKPVFSPEVRHVFDSINKTVKKQKWYEEEKVYEKDSTKSRSHISITPILIIGEGIDFDLKEDEVNYAGGAALRANYNPKFAMNVNFVSGFSSFPSYVDSVVKQNNVYPGWGRVYYKENGLHSWQYYSGYCSFSPNKVFNFQIGHDKQFWGDGYRSLFLSDNAAPYSFLKITTTVWKLKYVSMYAMMTDATHPSNTKNNFKKKYGTFHMLSWNVTKRINLNLFESIIWQGNDANRSRSYDVNYLNPLIFFRPLEYSVGSSDNAFLGLGYKIKVARHQQFYGQVLLDEFLLSEVKKDALELINPDDTTDSGWWANKQAYQFGFRSFDLLRIKNLDFQTEANIVRPYTYAHGSSLQSYGHMNQPLAHPLGANFSEWLSILNYRYKNFIFEAKYIRSVRGADTSAANYGATIFLSYFPHPNEYGNKIGQGLKINTSTIGFRASVLYGNTRFEVGFNNRTETSKAFSRHTPYLYFGIRTHFGNSYTDF